MKKIVMSLVLMTSFVVTGLFATGSGEVQAGIFANLNVLTVKCKPASDYSATSVNNIIFAIRWQTTAQYDGVVLSEITSTFGLAKEGPAWIDAGYNYQQYSVVGPTAITWTSGSQVPLGTITVTGGLGTGTFELAPSGTAINPATTGAGDWYIAIGGVDRTNYTTEFYQGSVSNVGLDVGLPVELTSFTAISNGRNVELGWKTATEKNSNKFEIERTNGKEWTKVNTINASGTSNAPKEYAYVDNIKSAVVGKISYRLKMIDNDGKFEYSQIAEVKIVPTVYALEQNYPNPFNPQTKIQYSLPMDAKVSLKVYDIVGREVATVVNEEQTAGYYEQKFGGYNFASGVYFYRIVAEAGGKVAFTSIKKMLMIK